MMILLLCQKQRLSATSFFTPLKTHEFPLRFSMVGVDVFPTENSPFLGHLQLADELLQTQDFVGLAAGRRQQLAFFTSNIQWS